MRVLIINTSERTGGAAIAANRLMTALKNSGIKAKMLVRDKHKERLLSIRERIINGEKFSTLARIYSQDPGSARKGGELGMASKSIFWPAFSDAAMALKPGVVSQIVETPDGFHIIEVLEKKGDMFNARHILLKPEYTVDLLHLLVGQNLNMKVLNP